MTTHKFHPTIEEQVRDLIHVIDTLRAKQGGPLKEWRELDIQAMVAKLREWGIDYGEG